MKRAKRWIKGYFAALLVLAIAQQALAASVGPFSFSFASPLLNSVFLFPLAIGGCL
jgi:hypothetical protein